MAKALAQNGAKKVYLVGRRLEVLQSAAKAHPALSPLQCDVTSKPSLQSAVDTITSEVGFINLLIANSGILGPLNRWDATKSVSDVRKALFTDFEMDGFMDTFKINTVGAFFTLSAFLELLDAGNKAAIKGTGFGGPAIGSSQFPYVQSQIIVTSSISAFSRLSVSPPPYTSSKAAVLHLTKHAATGMATYGIRVNAMCPGRKWFLSMSPVSGATHDDWL
jgi:NAD(P)-dependent dehydrogenase (short-subunit alcohol dehydrogenase family)